MYKPVRMILLFVGMVVFSAISGTVSFLQNESLAIAVAQDAPTDTQPATVYYQSEKWRVYKVSVSGGDNHILADGLQVGNMPIHVSLDGQWIAFNGGPRQSPYSISTSTGQAFLLRDDPSAYFNYFTISADNRYVVAQATNGVGLYSALLDGSSAAVNISEKGKPIHNYSISADGQHVVYLLTSDSITNLYSIPIAGGTPIQLNPRLSSGGNVVDMDISADGKFVVYMADQEADEIYNLYSVPITGGDVVNLSGDLEMGKGKYFAISPDSKWVAFDSFEYKPSNSLYLIPITGGTQTRLNQSDTLPGLSARFSFTPDSSHLVYMAGTTLYSVPTAGGNPIIITDGKITDSGQYEGVQTFNITPDSNHIVFITNPFPPRNIYVVPVTGGTLVKLNPDGMSVLARNVQPYTNEGSWAASVGAISPDSKWVVYGASDKRGINGIYSVSVEGGDSIKLNDRNGSASFVPYAQISADSSMVIYQNDQEKVRQIDIYSVPITGGTVVRLTQDDSPSKEGESGFFTLRPQGGWWKLDDSVVRYSK